MPSDTLSVRLDTELKKDFARICEDLGLSTSQAVKVFAKAVVNHGGIPFELKSKEPNATTLAAFKEYEEGKTIAVESAEAMFKEFMSEE